MSHREFTVLFERVAEILETQKGTPMSRAIRQAVSEYEKAVSHPKSRSIKAKNLTTDVLRKLANG